MSALPKARRLQLPPHRAGTGGVEPSVTLSVHEAGTGPAVVLCHGFPELMIPRCGHWTQQERPEELSRIALSWLRWRFSARAGSDS